MKPQELLDLVGARSEGRKNVEHKASVSLQGLGTGRVKMDEARRRKH